MTLLYRGLEKPEVVAEESDSETSEDGDAAESSEEGGLPLRAALRLALVRSAENWVACLAQPARC